MLGSPMYSPPDYVKEYVPNLGESATFYERRVLSNKKLAQEECWVIICYHAFQNKDVSSEWEALAKKYFIQWQVSLKQKSSLAMLSHQLNSLKVLYRLGKSSIITSIFLLVTACVILAVLGGSTAGIGIAVFALISGLSTLGLYWWTRRKTINAEKVVAEKEFSKWCAISKIPFIQDRDQKNMEQLCQFFEVPEDISSMRLFLFLNTLPLDNRQTIYASIILDLYKFNCHHTYPVTVQRLLETFVLYKDSKIEAICSLLFLASKQEGFFSGDTYEFSKLITDLLIQYVYENHLSFDKKMQLAEIIQGFIPSIFNGEPFETLDDCVEQLSSFIGQNLHNDVTPLIHSEISYGSTHETEMKALLGEIHFEKRQRRAIVAV